MYMKLTTAFGSIAAASLLAACHDDLPSTSNRFEVADTDHNGMLTSTEAGIYVASNLFEGIDKNNDHKLTRAEWVVGGDPMTADNFREADQDNDGVVNEAELQMAAIRSSQMREFITGADLNHDGGVTKAEAVKYYARREGPVR